MPGRHDAMREVLMVERKIVTEDGRTISIERRIRGLLSGEGVFRLLSYSGRRSSAPQQERSGHAKTA